MRFLAFALGAAALLSGCNCGLSIPAFDCAGCVAPFECVYDRNDSTYFCGFACTGFNDPRCAQLAGSGCRSCDGTRCSTSDGRGFSTVCMSPGVSR